jgi:LEA14-like dessication related protein
MDLITLGVLGYLATLFNAKKVADKLEYIPANVSLKKGRLLFTMDVLNPSGSALKVDSFFGGVYAGDNKIGNIEKGAGFSVAGNKRTAVVFPVVLNPVGLAALAANITKLKSMPFKIMGEAKALGVTTPINKPIKFDA